MIQSIYAGVSSLQSFQTGIDVLANNIANINTVGFRGSSTEFSNLFEKEISTSGNAITSMQSGLGVQVNAISLDLQKGEYYQTESQTDLAIVSDDGWFGLSAPNEEAYYTRAGNFHFDAYSIDGPKDFPFLPYDDNEANTNIRLVNPEGLFVTGTLANNTNGGVLNPVLAGLDLSEVNTQVPLIFPSNLIFPVEPTTQANFFGNLGIENIPQVVSAEVISPQSERNRLRLSFDQTSPSSWNVTATVTTADYDLSTGEGTLYDTQSGVINFDSTGSLISSTLPSLNNNGANVVANLGTGFSGIIANSGPSVVSSATVDGALAGSLVDYAVNRNGEVISNFTNGKQSVVAKVAIYHFQNDQGLEALGGNSFRASANSGNPIFYSQDNGQLLSGTLENSNVGLETALTELIIMQRSYDAAAKTISTSDQMLQNALQM